MKEAPVKAIVFGGSGFLGSHVADALLDRGHRVTIYDLRPSLYLRKGQSMIAGDILDADAVEKAVRGHDAVYNFAGHADIESAREKPLDTIRANILGNGVILEACRKAGVRRYVFASTVYVYSQAGSFYRASKQACEAYIEGYRQVYGLPYTILRFGSLYGPRSDRRNGIHRLLEEAVLRKKIVYPGDGEELREYIHVRDAAHCSVDILTKPYEDECVIITGQQAMRVKDLLAMVREMLGDKVSVRFSPGARPSAAGVHYRITPYSFVPKEGKKLVRTHYVDMGQGLLSLMGEFYRKSGKA